MTKVYIVTAGEYSDYHICGVFSTQKKAEYFCNHISKHSYTPKEWYKIEDWNVDAGILELARHKDIYMVMMDNKGNVKDADVVNNDYAFRNAIRESVIYNDIPNHYLIYVFAGNLEEAVKIASEKRTKYMVEKLNKEDK